MRILFFLDNVNAWKSGIWYHRQEVPGRSLVKRGHSIRQVAIGDSVPDEIMEFPNTVVFGRIYPDHTNPLKIMRDYKKQGKRVLCDMDDDYWAVDPANPSKFVSNAYKDMYEGMLQEADAITTPSKILAKKIKKLTKKPVFFCPNGIDFDDYKQRPNLNQTFVKERTQYLDRIATLARDHEMKNAKQFREKLDKIAPHSDILKIGYMGAASHWRDLQLIVDVLVELHQKYDFLFILYGMVGEPLDAAIYNYQMMLNTNVRPEQNEYFKDAVNFYAKLKNLKMIPVPFMPPPIHPMVLSGPDVDFDIGLAPLEDNEFNRAKSNIKFYEYAAIGTATLASDVYPYKEEVTYRAKNTHKDWYKKLEKLIVDVKFRKELAEKQQKWVKENRSIKETGLAWEMACQKPGGLEVNSQKEWKKKFKL